MYSAYIAELCKPVSGATAQARCHGGGDKEEISEGNKNRLLMTLLQLSLLIHPDKFKHEKAQDAFNGWSIHFLNV